MSYLFPVPKDRSYQTEACQGIFFSVGTLIESQFIGDILTTRFTSFVDILDTKQYDIYIPILHVIDFGNLAWIPPS